MTELWPFPTTRIEKIEERENRMEICYHCGSDNLGPIVPTFPKSHNGTGYLTRLCYVCKWKVFRLP